VPPIPWDYEEEQPQKSLTDYLADLPEQLHEALGDRVAFVDLVLLSDDGPLDGGAHPLVWLTDETAKRGLSLIPAVSPTRSAGYRAAVAAVVARDGLGACIRLPVGEWPSTASVALADLLVEMGIGASDVDLVWTSATKPAPSRSPRCERSYRHLRRSTIGDR
jgi:hypothetical protein